MAEHTSPSAASAGRCSATGSPAASASSTPTRVHVMVLRVRHWNAMSAAR